MTQWETGIVTEGKPGLNFFYTNDHVNMNMNIYIYEWIYNVIFCFPHNSCSFISAYVYSYLFVNFSKLLQVVFKKGNLLFLGNISPTIIRLNPCTLSTETIGALKHRYCGFKILICIQSGKATVWNNGYMWGIKALSWFWSEVVNALLF